MSGTIVAETLNVQTARTVTKPGFWHLATCFIFSWTISTVTALSSGINVGLFFDLKDFSLLTAVIRLVVTVMYTATGAYTLGTLTQERLSRGKAAVIYLLPLFISEAFGIASSMLGGSDHKVGLIESIVLPLICLIAASYTATIVIPIGQGDANRFQRQKAVFDIPWYHWSWLIPTTLFQCIGVPIFLLLLLWKIDLVTSVSAGEFPRIIVLALLCGVCFALNHSYSILSHGTKVTAISVLQVCGTWLLLSVLQVIMVMSWAVPHMRSLSESERAQRDAKRLVKENKISEAIAAYNQALDADRKAFGNKSEEVGNDLSSLGKLARKQKRFADAESLYKQAISIFEKDEDGSPVDSKLSSNLRGLSMVYCDQKKYSEAVDTCNRALAHDSQPPAGWQKAMLSVVGPTMSKRYNEKIQDFIGSDFSDLGLIYQKQSQPEKALEMYSQALKADQLADADDASVAYDLECMAEVQIENKNFVEAEMLYKKALALYAKDPQNNSETADALRGYGKLLRRQDRLREAE